MACNNCSSSPCNCETLVIQRGPRGFTGDVGASPDLTFEAETLAPGSPVTVSQSGGAGAYTIILGIPQGATGPAGMGTSGADGVSSYAPLATGFTQPAVGGQVNISTTTTFVWSADGEWIFISGGGSYLVSGAPVAPYTTLLIRNPGPADGYPSGVPGNASPGASVPSTGAPAQVTPSGRPALDGDPGAPGSVGPPGTPSFIGLTTTIPTLPPAPGLSTIFYTDDLVTPTVFRAYFYSGGSWTAGPSILGAPGTLLVSTGGDPNSTLPTGPIGTYAIRTDVPSVYVKTGASTWTFVVSLTPTFAQVAAVNGGFIEGATVHTNRIVGYIPLADTHAAPGTYTIDLQFQGIQVEADQDIELDYTNVSFTRHGLWVITVENTDASPIALTYATGRWYQDPAVTLPATIASGATQLFVIRKTALGMVIENTYVVTAV